MSPAPYFERNQGQAVLSGQINFQNPHSLPTGYASYRVIRGCGSANEQASEPERIHIGPAAPGEFVSLFGTGFGATEPSFEAGEVPGRQGPLATNDAQVTIGGIEVPSGDIFYIGVAPCCAGLYQLVVRIPPNASSGNHVVVVTIAGRTSAVGPYVAVQAP